MAESHVRELKDFNYYQWDKKSLENNTVVEYIWTDGSGKGLRGKTRVYPEKITKLE